jgi:hypothetical protein
MNEKENCVNNFCFFSMPLAQIFLFLHENKKAAAKKTCFVKICVKINNSSSVKQNDESYFNTTTFIFGGSSSKSEIILKKI